MTNVLILGANGQVGDAMMRVLKDTEYTAYGYTSKTVDYHDANALFELMREHSIRHVINCVAYTDVEKAEIMEDGSPVIALNTELPGVLAQLTRKWGADLTHFSTDYVFDGEKTSPYTEDDQPNPINYYGHTKLIGDKILKKFNNVRTFRVSMVYGNHGKNFVKTMQKLSTERHSIDVVFDQFTVPTQADWLAVHVMKALKTNHYGLYNLVPDGFCSPLELANVAVEGRCEIIGVPLAMYSLNMAAKRPKWSVLDNSKYKTTFGTENMHHWLSVYEQYQM